LSAEAGISQPYLAQMESGRRTGDVETHARLARVLDVRIEDLIAG
jgi:transcriptional regulator with XRE-family HTH domain